MCGISGIISKNNKLDRNEILAMNGMINHRGPDQSGYLEYKNILLGHSRLSVIDLSDRGRQPMSNDGRYWIIFNGEIYNYKEIKNMLQKKHKFYSKTDTEVILNAYKEWGFKCFEKFNGDWAFAILDKKKDELVIARDQIGCKPCYIYQDKNKIAFSSEIKSFIACNKDLNFDNNKFGVNEKSLYSYAETVFENVTQLPPGRYIKINLKDNIINLTKWWHPLENLPKIHPNYEINQGEYYELLYNATKLRLDADLKIGTSLSGGIDSSAIFTILNLIQNSKDNLSDLKIDLNPVIMNYNECKTTDLAINLAKKYKRNYKIIESPDYDLDKVVNICSKLEIIEEYFRQPLLYEEQKKMGIHVSIDGHGADEFLGMPSFLKYFEAEQYNKIVNFNNLTNNFGEDISKNKINKLLNNLENYNKQIKLDYSSFTDDNNYFKKYTGSKKFESNNKIIESDLDILKNFEISTQYLFFITHGGWMQWFLAKWDRACMSSAVEIRSPFLDKNLYSYSLALPMDKKLKNGKFKSILRDSMESILPKDIVFQNFKQGLPRIKNNYSKKNIIFMENILNEQSFIESNVWDSKLIKKEFLSKKRKGLNMEVIWEIMKYYLMLTGFKKRFNYMNENFDKFFYKPNNLSELS